jgi:hypothetical protein
MPLPDDAVMSLLFPHPAGTCSVAEVLDAVMVLRGELGTGSVFQGRDPWRFFYDLMHGALAVTIDGTAVELEAVTAMVEPDIWRRCVITAVRDMIDAVCIARAFEAETLTVLRMLQSEMGACVSDGSLAEAFSVAVLARDTVFDVAVSSAGGSDATIAEDEV